MRPSNRQRILEAAVTIANERGLGGVTFDSVSDAVGITKAGLLYHFTSKDALLLGIQEHLAALWEEELELAAGKSAHDASETERLVAYVKACGRSATRGELTMQLEAASNDTLNAPWAVVLERWRQVPGSSADKRSIALQSAALAADGMWSAEALGCGDLTSDARQHIVAHLVEMIESHSPKKENE